jgi:thioredoxin-dependent peroxiredoxin
MASIRVGDAAPQFTATAHNGERFSLADFRGQRVVVLFFYPADNTPVCTAEACAFRDAYEDFVAAGAQVVGISGDSAASHTAFAAAQRLPYLLVTDADGQIRRAYGVPKTFGIIPGRVTYVIDKQGVVQLTFNSQFSAADHVREALQMVKQLSQEA